jgi:hypothetical protein
MITIISPEAVNPVVAANTRRARMFRAIEGSYRAMTWARNLYDNMVTSYAGPTYGHQDARSESKYINKSAQFVNAYTMLLAGNNPVVAIESDYRELIPFAKTWQVNLESHLKRIDFKSQLQDCIKNSLMLMGIMKCHYAESGFVMMENELEADPGMCYASSISVKDFFFDMSVKKRGSARFAGDRYRMAVSKVKRGVEMGVYKEEALSIQHTSKTGSLARSAENLSGGILTDEDELEPMFDAADVYDYEEKKIRTYVVGDVDKMVLKGQEIAEYDWDGLEYGPYEMFGYWKVPDNVIPKSPLADVEAMDRFINNLAGKVARQAANQKDVIVYTGGSEGSADGFASARDRQTVKVDDLDGWDIRRQPGVDPSVSQTLANFLGLFDESAGNLRTMLGLGASTDTVGQDQLIAQANTRLGAFMEEQVMESTHRVVRNLSKMMWDDEFMKITSSILVSAAGARPIYVDSSWDPTDREGEYWQYLFRVVPGSMRMRSQAEKVQWVTQLLQQVFVPLQPHIMAQGGMFDVASIVAFYADETHTPELHNFITFAGGAAGGMPLPTLGGKPSVSQRNYTRRSIPSSQAATSAAGAWQTAESADTSQSGVMA